MIYVITHKTFDDSIVPDEGYRVLHVGMNDNSKVNYLRDDTGDNISSKNPYYCELTGLYWIWKNSHERPEDIVGLVHYRRFFTNFFDDRLYALFGKMPKACGFDELKKMCGDSKAIVPQRQRGLYSLEVAYSINHGINDLKIAQKSIKKNSPDYYKDFMKVFKDNIFFGYNMIVCKKKLLDQYCEWVFPILSDVEQRIVKEESRNDYQNRVYGFLSERLLQVWLMHNGIALVELPVFNTEKRTDTYVFREIKKLKASKLRSKRRKQELIDDPHNERYHLI